MVGVPISPSRRLARRWNNSLGRNGAEGRKIMAARQPSSVATHVLRSHGEKNSNWALWPARSRRVVKASGLQDSRRVLPSFTFPAKRYRKNICPWSRRYSSLYNRDTTPNAYPAAVDKFVIGTKS